MSHTAPMLPYGLTGGLVFVCCRYGEDHWWVPMIWILAICLIAGVEAAQRSQYTYAGATTHTCIGMVVGLVPTALFAFGAVIRPTPVWSPQYTIPVAGMLLGNSINGISLAFGSLLSDAAGTPFTPYTSNWLASNIWIRDVVLLFLPDPRHLWCRGQRCRGSQPKHVRLWFGAGGPNQNTHRIQHQGVYAPFCS